MNIELGKKIRWLRLQKGMTQEELAAKLNLSSQAVSKWENRLTLPDIQFLPQLSVILGVTIDELFALTDDTHLERIENMIHQEHVISEDDFHYAEQFLKGKLDDEERKSYSLTLLAELHMHRSDEHREYAVHYAKDAIRQVPHSKRNHNALRDAEKGVLFDWNYSNHHKLIAYYVNSDDWAAWTSRGDCMAKLCRYDEAVQYYSKGYELQPHPKYTDSLEAMCHIYSIQGNYNKAIEMLQEIISLLERDWNITEGKVVDAYKGDIANLTAEITARF